MIYKRRHRRGPGRGLVVLLNIIALILSPLATRVQAEEWTTVVSDSKPVPMEERLKTSISLDYKEADLPSVLRSLSWTYKLNIVTSPNIKGRVTISLKDVTVEKALGAILTVNGLTYRLQEDVIYVFPGDPEAAELKSKVLFLKYVRAADAQNMLRRILSGKGDMKIDEVANSLIIIDYPANIQKIRDLLAEVDVAPKQVLIEAMIVDITSTDLNALGVQWSVDYSPTHGLFGRHPGTNVGEQLQTTTNLAEQSSDLTGGQFILNTLNFDGLPDFTATIDALAKDGKANILASPSIAVLNGQEARIVIGERYPYKERTQTTTGTTETTKFVDIGTTLRVTPQINEDGYITMQVHPEVSSLAAALDAGPRITTREADTTVRVKQNQTLVIGGLIKHTDDQSKEKVPLLGSLPILGLLFSRSEKKVEQKELAVFITPRILRSGEEKELLAENEIEKEEVYVTLSKTASLNLVEGIFEKARKLDKGAGIESRRKKKSFRKDQALSLYEYIHFEHPDSLRAPDALYYAGMIYYLYKKDYTKAKDSFATVVSEYPDSGIAKKAGKRYRQMEKLEKRTRKRSN